MTQGKSFLIQSLPSILEGCHGQVITVQVQDICQCYLLYGSNEKLYFNKFKSNLHFIAKSDTAFLPSYH